MVILKLPRQGAEEFLALACLVVRLRLDWFAWRFGRLMVSCPATSGLAFLGVPLSAARLTKRSTGHACLCMKNLRFSSQTRFIGPLTIMSTRTNMIHAF